MNKIGFTFSGKPKKSRWKKVLKVFGIIVAVIALFMLVGSILHATYYKGKFEQISPYGQLVMVDDGQMHVYAMGHGEPTVVLLPGMGVGLPSADFGPLMRKLSEKYTVVCVDYFGVGFSSQTTKPRTAENYVEEIRSALSKAGYKAPYVLMAHSISSVYSEYYASKYPHEVQTIISLDGTSTAYYAETPSIVNAVLPVAKFQQNIGFTSLLAPLATNEEALLANGYTEKEISDMLAFAGFSMNDTVIAQMANSGEFIKQTMDLPYPATVPYLKIISRQTYETPNKQLNITPQEYQENHLRRIGQPANYEILEGTHFIYLNNVDQIAAITDKFLLDKAIVNGGLITSGDASQADGEDTAGYATYKSDVYKVSLKYAADWKLNPNFFERYGGNNGFFQVSAINGESLSIDQVAQDQAFHKLKPYGSAPQIFKRTIGGQEARLFLPSNDQPREMQNQAGLIVKYPTAIRIDDSLYNYFVLWADKAHIEQLCSNLSFL